MSLLNAHVAHAGPARKSVPWGGALASLRGAALAGVSSLALVAGLTAADSRPALAQDRTVVDGNSRTGFVVRGDNDGTFFGLNQLQSGTVVEDKIYTNFVTKGGDGSGGGAGLGGVFFVDAGSTLTIRNTEFNTNTAIGGKGGTDPGVSTGSIAVSLAGNQTSVFSLGGLIKDPGLTGSGSATTVSSIQLSAPNSLLKAGMKVTIPGITGAGVTAEIASVSGSTVTFKEPVNVSPVTKSTAALPSGSLTDKQVQFDPAALGSPSNPDIQVGSLIRGSGIPTGTTVKSIDFETGIVTLSDALSSRTTSYDFVQVGAFNATPFTSVTSSGGNTTIGLLEKPTGELAVGMVVTGEGIPDGARITAISSDGKSVTIDKAVPAGTTLSSLNAAAIAAKLGSNVIELPRANETLKAGMVVTGTGIPDNTVIQSVTTTTVNGKKVTTVTLDKPLAGTEVPASLAFSGVRSVSGSTITFVAGAMPEGIEEGQLISGPGIQPGVTVVSVNRTTGAVVLSSDIDDPEIVSSIKFASPLVTGGTMNGMASTGTGVNGMNGADNDIIYPLVNGGEGGDGYQAQDGKDGTGTGQAGGAGGNGGNGSDALAFQPDLTLAVALGSLKAINGNLQIGADLAPKGAPIPVPDPIKAAADAADLADTYVQLAKDSANLVAWTIARDLGRVAKGGDGGDGGDGGNGTDFFGGGVGGDGGDGGDGGVSASTGGRGGAGGAGGNGGFGAGGGSGGAGGENGEGKYAPVGSPGIGGRGGFGAGDGADGDGLFGGGGSGFGGAIFVRDGGQLTIEGNSTFSDNDVMGGSAGDRGKAGAQAGSDLFIMKGAQVTLRPGEGNTITFNGSIADDSRASFNEASNGTGDGADVTIAGPGLVVFNGTNTYTGQTIITGGTLAADLGEGIHEKSNVTFAGQGSTNGATSDLSAATAGVLMTNGDINRQIGTLSNRLQWTGSGGFAAKGGQLRINLGGLSTPQTLKWGSTTGFFSEAEAARAALIFGSVQADADVLFRNNIDLNGGSRQVVVVDNSDSSADFATIAGVISDSVGGGKLIVGSPNGYGGLGKLVLTGNNTYTGGTEVKSGILVTMAGQVGQTGVLADTGAIAVGQNGNLWLFAKDTVGNIDNDGVVLINADIVAGSIDNDGTFVLDGKLSATSFANDGTLSFEGGELTLSGTFTGGAGSSVTIGENTTLITAGLVGEGRITLSDEALLTLEQSGASTFAGVIAGNGGLTLQGGTTVDADLTLTGTNTYTGKTTVADNATLNLSGSGSIAASSDVEVNGDFDIAATTSGASIKTLSGDGAVALGTKTLTVTAGSTEFEGTIGGTGGLTISGGTQTLSGDRSYTGATTVQSGATLKLADNGSISDSSGVDVTGTFDVSDADGPVLVQALTGSSAGAAVKLGANELQLTAALAPLPALSQVMMGPSRSSPAARPLPMRRPIPVSPRWRRTPRCGSPPTATSPRLPASISMARSISRAPVAARSPAR